MGFVILTVHASPADCNTDSIFTKSRLLPRSSEAMDKTSLQKMNQMKNISYVLLHQSE